MAKVLAIEPFYGGSHRAFVDGLVERSCHEFRLLTQPACFWKWRMRGAALTLSDKANKLRFRSDLVLCSDMLSLSDFKALYEKDAPALLYMHENQLCYPVPSQDQRDLHFGFTNIASCLAADQVVWNSQFHMESFLSALPGFIRLMPDQRPARLAKRIREKSLVIPPGIDLSALDGVPLERELPPLILWNHRWEFDKGPEFFFDALQALLEKGLRFRVAVLGENFQAQPRVFLDAQDRFGDRIAHFGYVESREEYLGWLRRSWVSVSTASQENFGIASVEAAYAGALPLWPDRLSYPELIPPSLGIDHLYSDFSELVLKLEETVKAASYDPSAHTRHADCLRRFDWPNLIEAYDELIEKVARG